MPVVFVHGVPETPSIWDALIAELGRDDIVNLQLPGFGCALPAGFEPVMESYATWLAQELSGLEAVDLVGHDWGAFLALRILASRPGQIRSWVVDSSNLHDGFEWHDTAKLFQTAGAGEDFVDGFVAAPVAESTALLTSVGAPTTAAEIMAEHLDVVMGQAILALYRSATDIGTEWGPGIDNIVGPGLVVEARLDAYRAPGSARSLGERTGARILDLPDNGHWWMCEDPTSMAEHLEEFWSEASP